MNFIFFKEKQKVLPYIFGGFLFLADRVLKCLAVQEPLPFFRNNGLVFSLPVGKMLALAVSIGIWLIVVVAWQRKPNPALLFIIIGGASNIIDRVRYGGVIDYIFIIPFAPFNLADVMILAGIVIFFLSSRKNVVS